LAQRLLDPVSSLTGAYYETSGSKGNKKKKKKKKKEKKGLGRGKGDLMLNQHSFCLGE
jgi:hypothetical protein